MSFHNSRRRFEDSEWHPSANSEPRSAGRWAAIGILLTIAAAEAFIAFHWKASPPYPSEPAPDNHQGLRAPNPTEPANSLRFASAADEVFLFYVTAKLPAGGPPATPSLHRAAQPL
jgi:hypothetical protein